MGHASSWEVVDDGIEEELAITAVLQALVSADLDDGSRWSSADPSALWSETELDEGGTWSMLQASMVMQQVLIEIACRPTTGRTRAEVISIMSHAVRCVAAARRADPHHVDLPQVVRRFGTETFQLGAATVDLAARTLHLAGKAVSLTAQEWSVLSLLLFNRDRAVTRQELHDAIGKGDSAVVTQVVNRLRRKLGEDHDNQKIIRTAWGLGYKVGPSVTVEHRTRSAD